MDPITLAIIIAIIVVIIILDFYKRQQYRITSNLHADNLKQLLTITALDYKFSSADAINETDPQLITTQITQLINCYERGEMHADAFQAQMDYLLDKLN